MKLQYERYARCVVRIAVKTKEGDIATGTGFHIGDGLIVTARHVVEGTTIHEIISNYYQEARLRENRAAMARGERDYSRDTGLVNVKRVLVSKTADSDLAIIDTDYEPFAYRKTVVMASHYMVIPAPFIPIGLHLDDWSDDGLMLSRVLVIGYPPIAKSRGPYLLAATGEVNAIVDRYDEKHVHFVISTQPRGGLSGGPVISEYDFLLGVIVDSLRSEDAEQISHTMATISVEPLLNLLAEYGLTPPSGGEHYEDIYKEKIAAARAAKKHLGDGN